MKSQVFWCLIAISFLRRVFTITVTTRSMQKSRPGVSVTVHSSFSVSANGALIKWQKILQSGPPVFIAQVSHCSDVSLTTCELSVSNHDKYSVEGSLSSGVNLDVHALTLDDSGYYECRVSASSGIIIETVHLIVFIPPAAINVFDVESGSSVKYGTAYIVIGRSHMLNCSVPTPSRPPPEITWTSDDVTLKPKIQMDTVGTDNLLVTSFREVAVIGQKNDTGNVILCSADHLGLVTPLLAHVTIEAGNLPGCPGNLSVPKSSITADSLSITWLQGNSGGKPQTFTISSCPIDNLDECMEESDIQPTFHSLYNLKPSTVYTITVKSHTVFGYSENNENVEVTTGRPPRYIALFYDQKSENVSNKIIYVNRHQEHQLMCFIPSYSVQPAIITWFSIADDIIKETTNQTDTSFGLLINSSSTAILQPATQQGGANLEIACIAKHPDISSPLRASAILSIGDVPEPPTSLSTIITSSSVVVSWTPHAIEGIAQTYTVEHCAKSSAELYDCEQMSGIEATNFEFSSFRPFTVYRIMVISQTVFGESENKTYIEVSLKPPSPAELGVQAHLEEEGAWVEVSRMDTSFGVLPDDICFFIITRFDINVMNSPNQTASDCIIPRNGIVFRVPINDSILTGLQIVSFWNGLYSEGSPVNSFEGGYSSKRTSSSRVSLHSRPKESDHIHYYAAGNAMHTLRPNKEGNAISSPSKEFKNNDLDPSTVNETLPTSESGVNDHVYSNDVRATRR